MSKATLTRHRIKEIYGHIEAGQPIVPQGEIWTLADGLAVAGVILSFTMQGHCVANSLAKAGQKNSTDRLQELQAAIEFTAALATAHRSGTWDDYFEPTLTIGIAAGRCTPLSGFKK